MSAGVAVPLGWLLSRRPRVASAPSNTPSRRGLRAAATALAIAPALLWGTAILPGGLLRKAMASDRAPRDPRPNLILITVDALRADHIGAYGSPAGLTPNLDAFARGATRYTAAYASSCWTSPSLAALLTSLLPSQSLCDPRLSPEARGDDVCYTLADEVPLLPEQLGRAGYITAAELTNHFLSSGRGWSRGFDCFRNESPDEDPVSERTVGQHVTERAREWLRLNHREPFFLWVHYLDTHVPYDAPTTPADLRARYPRGWVATAGLWLDDIRFRDQQTRARCQEFLRRMYAEEVRYADRWVGELLADIKAAGFYDRSLIVITADHGEELFDLPDDNAIEHGRSMHEAVVRVPLLVKWPQGMKADACVTQTVALADLHDTLLHLARVQSAGAEQARELPRQSGLPGATVFSEWLYYGKQQAALTTDRYKVIYEPDDKVRGGAFEVYDRRTDRRERCNLAHTSVAADLRAQLQRLTQAALASRRLLAARHRFDRRRLSPEEQRVLRSLGYLGN